MVLLLIIIILAREICNRQALNNIDRDPDSHGLGRFAKT